MDSEYNIVMPAPKEILDLVERFSRNIDDYKSGKYNETQVRHQFVDPLFEALGWDINNKQGISPAYIDVIHEDSISDGSMTKAPDYCFRVGKERKFFVEAKKPSVNIKEDINPAFQVRRYAWSAKLPLSITTDFEEFAVYDCRYKPRRGDKASVARIKYIYFTEYAEKWDEIASVFSREAVLQGSFDKYAEIIKSKKGTAEIDDVFLEDIESWRKELAKNLAINNQSLTQRQLNYAVQKIIDRIIFLRICEDRNIENALQLMALLNGNQVYRRLCEIFQKADNKYNSGLFHFNKNDGVSEPIDEFTLSLRIDDETLKDIIKKLYYPESPYEFSYIPANILGQVYEQFLGKVIRLTKTHMAEIEEKPEVRKAGGVYYTPTYIVEYIVNNTLGNFLESKNPDQVSKIKVLDPACGSGSFLISAYQYLIDWHKDWYIRNEPEKWTKKKNPPIYKNPVNEWVVSINEKKRILLNNLFGVDIDAQAVEVTKLSLLLKVLEGETDPSLNTQLSMFQERVLPNLGNNIKCGNSLIGSNYYDGQLKLLGEEETYKVNAFDWNKAFPEIFTHGGFDIVLGNPPYGYMISKADHDYFRREYKHQDYQLDLYLLFLEKYFDLLKDSGVLGVIVSNTWLQSLTLKKIRQYLASSYKWTKMLLLPDKVFRATVDTHVLIFSKSKPSIQRDNNIEIEIRVNNQVIQSHNVNQNNIPADGNSINVGIKDNTRALFKKIIDHSYPLMELCDVYNGIKPFEEGKGKPPQTKEILKKQPYISEGKYPGDGWFPLLRGGLIQRYDNLWNKDYWIKYGEWLAAPRDPAIFSAPEKIMVRQTGDSIIAAIIDSGVFARNNIHILIKKDNRHKLSSILGIMNSKLIDFIYQVMNPEKGEALAEVKKQHVEMLPIVKVDFKNQDNKNCYRRIGEIAGKISSIKQRLHQVKTEQEKSVLQRQTEELTYQINQLVYKLYNLTDEEVNLVEGETSK